MARMKRMALVVAGLSCAVTVAVAGAQQSGMGTMKPAMGMDASNSGMSMKKMTKTEKIANAIAAAPAGITAKAAIYDWPAMDGAAPVVLRAGTNGWSCYPDMPMTKGNDPMCLDETWRTFLQAYLEKKTPTLTALGIGYMMAPGGEWGSNTDPYATMETKDNHWGHHGPHIMVAMPDAKSLAGVSTDHMNGGPYVMWAGTPYAHVMVPTGK
jgi:hypothetical protein